MSRFPQYNVNNEHQLIRRQNTYVLDRQLVTIHSEDRDIKKWPNSNHFEIDLPETLVNVQSMRLVEIGLPNNQYIFSNSQQNTKMRFYLIPKVSTNTTEYLTLALNVDNPYTITIQEGSYTQSEMAFELQNLMNQAVTDYLIDAGISGANYDRFTVYYDSVGQVLYFGNTFDDFIFKFQEQIIYDISCTSIIVDKQPEVFNHYSNWGLPSFLGFDKQVYNTQVTSSNITFQYNNYTWLVPDTTILPPSQTPHAYYIKAPCTTSIYGDSAIYMELEKYNTMAELNPYSEKTNNMYNNDYNGRVNSAFAKIPITTTPGNQIFDSRTKFLQNMSQYFPPIDKIRKLKFKFRYHDGRLVEFKENNFNFTIAFHLLKDEIARDYELRVPHELYMM